MESQAMLFDVTNFRGWADTGRFVNRASFEMSMPNENLHFDCTDVVVYHGGLYIQALRSGVFFLDAENTDLKLDNVEKVLWGKNSEKIINKMNKD